MELTTNKYDKPVVVQFAAKTAAEFGQAAELVAGKVRTFLHTKSPFSMLRMLSLSHSPSPSPSHGLSPTQAPSLPPPLPLSLSRTPARAHTHTHTHTGSWGGSELRVSTAMGNTGRWACVCMLACVARQPSIALCIPHPSTSFKAAGCYIKR